MLSIAVINGAALVLYARAAGCIMVRPEKRSGCTTTGRDELRIALDISRKGDLLMVTRIDRLGAASETCRTSSAL